MKQTTSRKRLTVVIADFMQIRLKNFKWKIFRGKVQNPTFKTILKFKSNLKLEHFFDVTFKKKVKIEVKC